MWRKRLQLALIHVAVAMTLVPIQSTLNRVMIKELLISATLVAALASLPYLFSPIQVAIGSFSDRHPLFGLRRTPYIALGLACCVVGVIASPYAAFAFTQNWWSGFWLSVLAFGLWGMGFNFATASYFSLASELSDEKGRSHTIGVMFFLMIVGIIVTADRLGRLLEPYSPEALLRAFLIVGLAALVLGVIGLLGLEPRAPRERGQRAAHVETSWGETWRALTADRQTRVFFVYLVLMLVAILGQDILLEPFAGHAFGMSVADTTRITRLWGACFLLFLLVAGWLETRVDKRWIVIAGSTGAAASFGLLIVSGLLGSVVVFQAGVALLGLATGLATVSNLSLMLDMTRAGQVGLFIGAWGTANAFARLVGNLLSGAVRDVITQLTANDVIGYLIVFGIEAGLLLLSLWLLRYINTRQFQTQVEQPSVVERAAIAGGA